MASRKRSSSESFKTYRANLKAVASNMKTKLAGTYVHISTQAPKHHVKGNGSTYVRGTGTDGNINRQF